MEAAKTADTAVIMVEHQPLQTHQEIKQRSRAMRPMRCE